MLKLFKETFIYGLGAILPKVINFAYTFFFAALFDPSRFSQLSELYAFSFIIIGFLTFGLETSYFRFLYKGSKSDAPKVYSTTQICLLSIASLALIFGLLQHKDLAQILGYKDHPEYLSLFMFIIFFDVISTLPMAWLRANGRPIQYTLVKLANIGAQTLALTYLLISTLYPQWMKPFDGLIHQNIIKRAVIFTDAVGFAFLANLFGSLVGFVLLVPIIAQTHWSLFSLKQSRKMLAYGTPIMLGTLAFAINENLDKIVLKRWVDPKTAGAYAACYRIAVFMSLYATAFRLGAEPLFFRKSKEKNAPQLYARVTYFFTLFGLIALFFIYANTGLIADVFFSNKAYHMALDIVPIVLLANLCLGVYSNLSIAYKVTDKTFVGTLISLLGAAITLLGNAVFLLFKAPYQWAAWVTLFSYGSMMFVSYLWGQKHYPIPYYGGAKLFFYLIFGLLLGFLVSHIQYFALSVLIQVLFLILVLYIERKNLSTLKETA